VTNDEYLQSQITMPDGKPYWFPMQSVSIG